MSRSRLIRRLLGALRPVRGSLALSIGARLVQTSLDVALVGAAAWLLADTAFSGAGWSWEILAVLAGMGVVKAVARYVEQYLGHHVAFGLLASLRVRFFDALRPVMPAGLAEFRSGDLVDRMTSDVDRVEVFYAHTLAPVVSGVVIPLLAVGAVGTLLGPTAALWLLATVIVAGAIVPAGGARLAGPRLQQASSAGNTVADHLTDGIQGIADVVGFGDGSRRLSQLSELAGRVADADRGAASADAVRSFAFDLVAGLGFVVVLREGLELLAGGVVEPGPLAAGVALALVAFVPLRDLQEVKPAFDRAMESARRVFEVIDLRPVVEDPSRPVEIETRPGLEMRSVSFAYPNGTVALSEVDLTVSPGRKVAVVGTSGSGKSTLAALAVRFWDADEGQVLVGGIPVTDLTLADVRRSVAVVSQRSHLVSGSVADNLRIGRPDATDVDLERVARAAALHELVSGLPHGYDTPVGEWGGRLSGGQRQRVALARALLADTPILIMDEATSDLDVDTEAEVMAGVAEMTSGRALVVIAHRLATVVDADEILVMDGGRVVERGDHATLIEAGGLYSRLWARQLDTLP